jgi:mRNA interferase MazF
MPTKTNGLTLPSAIQLSQIRSVDRSRLLKRIGKLEPASLQQVDQAIKISLGLVPLQ